MKQARKPSPPSVPVRATAAAVLETPDGLSERSQSIWRSVAPRRARSAERLLLIEQALRLLDRADAAAAAIARDGLTAEPRAGGKMRRAHPLLAVEQKARIQFSRIWDRLGLQWWAPLDGIADRPLRSE